jgi:hypothetical protein
MYMASMGQPVAATEEQVPAPAPAPPPGMDVPAGLSSLANLGSVDWNEFFKQNSLAGVGPDFKGCLSCPSGGAASVWLPGSAPAVL